MVLPAMTTGASFTGFTLMLNCCTADVSTPPFAVPPLSWSYTETIAVPNASGAGVYVSTPAALTAGCTLKSALLLFVTLNVSVCPASSAGPLLIAVAQPLTVCRPESSFTFSSAPLVKLGASLTALTVITNCTTAVVSTPPFATPPLSCSCTLTVAVPFAFATGVNVNTPAALIDGCALKSALLLFETMKLSACAASSAPPPGEIAEAHAALYAPLSSFTVTAPPAVKTGTSFTALIVIVTVAVFEVFGSGLPFVVPLSVTLYVNESMPFAFAFGVYVSAPFALRFAVPFVGFVNFVAVSVLPSASVSFVSTPGATIVSG